MNVPTRRKGRAGILPASFVAAGWKPALLFQLAIVALAITPQFPQPDYVAAK
jgi:hypothetical protein